MTKNKKKIEEKNEAAVNKRELRDKKKNEPVEIKGILRAMPVILFAVALFVALCFITAQTGAFGNFISEFLKGLFSYMAYTIPFFIAINAIFFYENAKRRKIFSAVVLSLIALITLSEIAYLIANFSTEPEFSAALLYQEGIANHGGGFIGGFFGIFLTKLVGKVGLIVIIALTIALYVLYFIYGGKNDLSRFMLEKLGKIADFGADMEKRSQEKKRKRKEAKLESKRASDDKKHADFYNDNYFNADNGVKFLEIPELGILEQKDDAANSHVLRESVIKPTANADTPQPTKDSQSISYEEEDVAKPKFTRITETPDGFKADDIIYEPQTVKSEAEEESAPTVEVKKETIRDFGLDDSADAIFTAEFDPFDIALNEKRAAKQSSRAAELQKEDVGFSEFIADMTPEQAEQKRRLEQFERSRREALRRKEEADAAARKAIDEENTRVVAERESYVEPSQEQESEASANQNTSESYAEYTEKNTPAAAYTTDHYEVKQEPERAEEPVQSNEPEPESAPRIRTYGYQSVKEIADINSDYETQYGMRSASQNQYRFAKEVAEEVRRPYASSEATVQPQAAPEIKKDEESAAPAYTYSRQDASSNNYISIPVQEERAQENTSAVYEEPASVAEPEAPASKEEDKTLFEEFVPKAASNVDFSTEDSHTETVNANIYSSAEFTFGEKESEPSMLEVSRSMLNPNLEVETVEEETIEEKSGLDFSTDEEEPEEGEDSLPDETYAEDVVEKVEIPESEWNPKLSEYRSMFTVLDDSGDLFGSKDGKKADDVDTAPNEEDTSFVQSADDADMQPRNTEDADGEIDGIDELSDDAQDQDDEDPFDEPPFDEPTVVSRDFDNETKPKKEEKPKPAAPDYSNYKFPPYDLLKKAENEDADTINDEMQFGADQLLNTLESFNIKATMKGMERGPRITRYSIVPAKGIRVSQIEKLSDDIALAMAAESIRIEAPIPGKSAVGIEVPNKVPSIVSLRELLESSEFVNEKSKTTVCIGKSVEGMNVFGDIGNMPHLLIAGATGMGKSVCMNSLITSILYKARPDEVKFIMIDPKKVEFAPYNGIPHLLVPVVTDPKQAAGALLWAVDEMNKRYDIIEKQCVRNIDSYNEKVSQNPELGAPMPKIVILIDELNDLMIQVRDPVENLIMLIAQKARAAGIHLVIGTQRPSVNVITGVIKANIPSRIACKVSSGIDSRTILEQTGAEKLIGKGDMLFAPSGKASKRVQGAFVSESETASIVDFVKSQVKGDLYDEQAMEDMKRAAQKCDKKNGDDDADDDDGHGSELGFLHDRKFLQAVEIAIRNGSVATSFLQRRLSIGYGKAAKYIDTMEDLGLIEEKNGSKARNVLVSIDEWNEKLARLTSD